MVAAPTLAVELAAIELAATDAMELATGVEEGAVDEVATDEGARLLAGAIEDAGLDAGVEPPPLPPPPPQAESDPKKDSVIRSFDGFINRSVIYLI